MSSGLIPIWGRSRLTMTCLWSSSPNGLLARSAAASFPIPAGARLRAAWRALPSRSVTRLSLSVGKREDGRLWYQYLAVQHLHG
jgi:hypothetical protein